MPRSLFVVAPRVFLVALAGVVLAIGPMSTAPSRLLADEPPGTQEDAIEQAPPSGGDEAAPASDDAKPKEKSGGTDDGDRTDSAEEPAKEDASNDAKSDSPAAETAEEDASDDSKVDRAQEEEELDDYELQRLLVETIDQVERAYVTPIDRRRLIEAAIRGVLSELDPYSNYIPPENMQRFHRAVDEEFGGIGIRIEIDRDQLIVLTPMPDTPAFEAGIAAGDAILEIDGESTEGLRLDEAVTRLQGEVGTDVKLVLRHRGQTETYTATLTREVIEIETVLGFRRKSDGHWNFYADAAEKIAYVRLSGFSRHTDRWLRRALAELKDDGMRALILDLRFNPGGLLSSAIAVCDLFIDDGVIVSIQGRAVDERAWTASRRGTFEDFPMVVLVNHYSASASEITSACLQDHARAVVMGERTWGKGSVQNVIEMEGGASALKITTASYHRPSGRNIHRIAGARSDDVWGVMPDEGFVRPLSDAQDRALLELFRQRDIIPAAGGSDEEKNKSPKDPHLAMALEHLRGALDKAEQTGASSTDSHADPTASDEAKEHAKQ